MCWLNNKINSAELNKITMKAQQKSTPLCWVLCESDEQDDGDKELMMSISYQDDRLQRGILKFNVSVL